MINHPAESTLHQLVDRELSGSSLHAAEAHVAGCPECGALVARLERLRRAATAAPREIAAPADLWQRIAVATPRRRRTRRITPVWWLAAASLVGVAAVGGMTLRGSESAPAGTGSPTVALPAAPAGVLLKVQRTADVELLRELEARLAERQHQLAPETISAIEENLHIIDEAIAATRRALAADPGNRYLEEMMEQSRTRRADYLRTTLTLVTS